MTTWWLRRESNRFDFKRRKKAKRANWNRFISRRCLMGRRVIRDWHSLSCVIIGNTNCHASIASEKLFVFQSKIWERFFSLLYPQYKRQCKPPFTSLLHLYFQRARKSSNLYCSSSLPSSSQQWRILHQFTQLLTSCLFVPSRVWSLILLLRHTTLSCFPSSNAWNTRQSLLLLPGLKLFQWSSCHKSLPRLTTTRSSTGFSSMSLSTRRRFLNKCFVRC